MSTKNQKKPKVAEEKSTAIVLHEISLTARQTGIINQETPKDLVKSKPGRGGRKVSFVEGGYVISKLNQAFSPLGWDFEVVEHGIDYNRKPESNTEGEVWVKGKLTIIDHVKGYKVSKTQFGQHPIHKNIPVGDALKAAGTDSLKKCASLLGIALDVYWGTLDTEESQPAKAQKLSPAEAFERAKLMLKSVKDASVLIEYDEKLKDSKVFSEAQKKELHALISAQVDQINSKQK